MRNSQSRKLGRRKSVSRFAVSTSRRSSKSLGQLRSCARLTTDLQRGKSLGQLKSCARSKSHRQHRTKTSKPSKTTKTRPATINDLPPEIMDLVLQNLNEKDVASVSRTSKHMNTLTKDFIDYHKGKGWTINVDYRNLEKVHKKFPEATLVPVIITEEDKRKFRTDKRYDHIRQYITDSLGRNWYTEDELKEVKINRYIPYILVQRVRDEFYKNPDPDSDSDPYSDSDPDMRIFRRR